MENNRTDSSGVVDENHEVSLREKLDSTQTLGNKEPHSNSSGRCKDDVSNPTSGHGIKRVKKEGKKPSSEEGREMGKRKNKKESSLKNSSRGESLPKGTGPDHHNETRGLCVLCPPSPNNAVSYTHLTLPTKRIV